MKLYSAECTAAAAAAAVGIESPVAAVMAVEAVVDDVLMVAYYYWHCYCYNKFDRCYVVEQQYYRCFAEVNNCCYCL